MNARKSILGISILLVTVSALFFFLKSNQFPQYKFTDLGILGEQFSRANDINNHGCVVGTPERFVPFIFQPDKGYIDINQLSFLGDTFDKIADVFGMNDRGQFVGHAHINDDEVHAYVMTPKSDSK